MKQLSEEAPHLLVIQIQIQEVWKSFWISHAASYFFETETKIWTGFGPAGNNIWNFFFMFSFPKNKIRFRVSACTKKLIKTINVWVKVFFTTFWGQNRLKQTLYRGFSTYAVFTTADPTTAVFGFCMYNWGIFALVGDPLQFHKHIFFQVPKSA